MKVFVDTGAFCTLTIPKDEHNQKAKVIDKQLKDCKAILYTSDYILDEVYTLLKMRGSHATSIKFMDQLQKIHITIFRITDEIEDHAKVIFRQFEDRKLSFTDCTSFALINHFDINAVFAFNEHFRYHPYTHVGPNPEYFS